MRAENIIAILFLLNSVSDSSQLDIVEVRSEAKHPFMVSVWENRNYRCIGIIIGEKWVLTSAQCLSVPTQRLFVQYGMNITVAKRSNSISVQTKYIHIEFEIHTPLLNDIGLLALKRAIPFDYKTTAPIKLMEKDYVEDTQQLFGTLVTRSSNRDLKTMKLVAIPVIIETKSKCYSWPISTLNPDKTICTRHYLHNYKTSECFDFGGILLYNNTPIGIANFNINYCYPPTLYTKISKYVAWIKSFVEKA